jgi:hypothetical protein
MERDHLDSALTTFGGMVTRRVEHFLTHGGAEALFNFGSGTPYPSEDAVRVALAEVGLPYWEQRNHLITRIIRDVLERPTSQPEQGR